MMDSLTVQLLQRVSTLETEVKALHAANEAFGGTLEAMAKSIAHIDKNMAKQQSFVGGVVFVISAIWAFIIFGKDIWLAAKGAK